MKSRAKESPSTPSPLPVFLQEPVAAEVEVLKDPSGTASNSVVAHVAVRELSRLGHRSLIGSGLRTDGLGAVVVGASPSLQLRASALAEDVSSELGLGHAQVVGFGGPLSFYQGLFYSTATVRHAHFPHVLLLHIGAREIPGGWALVSHGILLGESTGPLKFLGLSFGHVKGGDWAEIASSSLSAQTGLSAQEVRRSEDLVDQGAKLVLDSAVRGAAGKRVLIGAVSKTRWAAAMLEVGQHGAHDIPVIWDGSVQSHLRRAIQGGFPLSMMRVVVSSEDEGVSLRSAVAVDELERRIKGSVRAFDDVTRLTDGSFLVVLPRADEPSRQGAGTRLERVLGQFDPAGEIGIQVKVHGLTIQPDAQINPAEIERALGTPVQEARGG